MMWEFKDTMSAITIVAINRRNNGGSKYVEKRDVWPPSYN